MTLLGLNIKNRLLAGSLDSSALQTELGDDNYLAAFKNIIASKQSMEQLISDETAFTAIAGSALASGVIAASDKTTKFLCRNSQALYIAFTNSSMYQAYVSNTNNKIRMRKQVNAGRSKLKRLIYTADNTFTQPTNGMLAYILAGVGGGGGGGSASADSGGGGGGGGQSKFIVKTSGLTSENIDIVIGNSGAPVLNSPGTAGTITTFTTSITSTLLLSSAGGGGGSGLSTGNGPFSGGSGGGSTSGGSVYDGNLIDAFWPVFADSSVKGGDGGEGRPGNTGENGEDGIFGSGGLGHVAYSIEASPGTGFGSGGGGGGSNGTFGGRLDAQNNSGCGASGGSVTNFSAGTGYGGTGFAVIYYIEK